MVLLSVSSCIDIIKIEKLLLTKLVLKIDLYLINLLVKINNSLLQTVNMDKFANMFKVK